MVNPNADKSSSGESGSATTSTRTPTGKLAAAVLSGTDPVVARRHLPEQRQVTAGGNGRSLVTQSQYLSPITSRRGLGSSDAGIDEPERRTSGCGSESSVKMVGYLEKRSKMIGWKRYWFVLDGHLLTYYRNRADYDGALSACVGSINLGLASSVRPLQIRGCRGYPIQITTRSQIYYLRSLDKSVLEKWLIALQETSCAPPKISSPTWADPGVQFYRYSFAPSASQWSLAFSTDDISGSLRDLPRNFYLKPPSTAAASGLLALPPGQMSKSQSMACLAPPRTLTPPSAVKLSTAGGSAAPLRASSSAMADRRPGSLTNSPAPPAKPVRQATSMLMLPNSPAEAELRRELNTKLSGSGSGTLLRASGTNIKEIEEGKLGKRESGVTSGEYDEIIDFEASYPRRSATSDSASVVSSIRSAASSVSTPSSPLPAPIVAPPPPPQEPYPSPSTSPWEVRAEVEQQSRIIYYVEEEGDGDSEYNASGKHKKKGIGGFFKKMFKKDKDKERDKDKQSFERTRARSGSSSSAGSRSSSRRHEPVISGPVDLRARGETRGRACTMGATVGEMPSRPTLLHMPNSTPTSTKKSPTGAGAEPPRSPQLESVMAELRTKVGQINKNRQEEPEPMIKDTIPPFAGIRAPEITKSEKVTPIPVPAPTAPEDYENKLEKFNRLSAHLNPTFVAALNKPAAVNKEHATANGHGSVFRSNSLSARYGQQAAKEEPPSLPPKKRRANDPFAVHQGTAPTPAYDVPQNNEPIDPLAPAPDGLVDLSSFYVRNGSGDVNGSDAGLHSPVTRLRDLTKKNSAPDVIFGPPPDDPHTLPLLLQLNIVPIPPPPPPEMCPCGMWPQDEDELPPPLPMVPAPAPSITFSALEPQNGEGSISPKSIDGLDNLDALSDISAGGGGNGRVTPPTGLQAPNSSFGHANVYENLPPLNYAAINTIELETVEENEDELYDEFVIEDTHAIAVGSRRSCGPPRMPLPLPPHPATPDGDDDVFQAQEASPHVSRGQVQSVRHSGIDALQRYLFQESTAGVPAGAGMGGAGAAINRLGHSAAINQLHALIQNDK